MINNKKRGNNFALKLFATVTSLLLAASVITTAVCFATNTWQLTPKDDVVQEQPEDQTPEEDQTFEEGGMQIGEAQGSGIKVMSKTITAAEYEEYGISPMAESAQQLTATITPEDATNKAVDWTVRFKDASSEWATGKTVTDYVTVTPTSDGALTANVQCLQAFGEQIEVVVTSRDNPEASAICKVDYAARITGASIKFSTLDETYTPEPYGTSNQPTILLDTQDGCNYETATYEVTLEYSDYTVMDDFELTVTAQFNPTFVQALNTMGISGGISSMVLENGGSWYFGSCFAMNTVYEFAQDGGFESALNWNKYVGALAQLNSIPVENQQVVASIILAAEGQYSSVSNMSLCYIRYPASGLVTHVEDVNISGNGSIIF